MYRPESSKTLDLVTKDVDTPPAVNLKRVVTIIPARYGSTRFPGKPLALIDGIPMVQQVVKRVKESRLAEGSYVVATDDPRIQDALIPFETATVMTRTDHASGSDRIWEAFQAISQDTPDAYDWIINLQGDEPFISPEHLDTLLHAMQTHADDADIVTLVTPYFSSDAPQTQDEANALLDNTNRVKALYTPSGKVLYFSRLPIPFLRNGLEVAEHCQPDSTTYFRHIGVYAYKVKALERFVEAGEDALERAEQLEQLRALALGMSLYAGLVPSAPVGVDTPEDLANLLNAPSAVQTVI
ncbi:MAG: 3-deoxy-manno-octulosonate cytidylyltransferase [Vampirovibrionales bacterium]